jgi:hypothetical protein
MHAASFALDNVLDGLIVAAFKGKQSILAYASAGGCSSAIAKIEKPFPVRRQRHRGQKSGRSLRRRWMRDQRGVCVTDRRQWRCTTPRWTSPCCRRCVALDREAFMLSEDAERYIEIRRTLDFKLRLPSRHLQSFARFATELNS